MSTNTERAERAAGIVEDYRNQYDDGEDYETVISDLLADLMHFAESAGLDAFDMLVDRAELHFTEEQEEEANVS